MSSLTFLLLASCVALLLLLACVVIRCSFMLDAMLDHLQRGEADADREITTPARRKAWPTTPYRPDQPSDVDLV